MGFSDFAIGAGATIPQILEQRRVAQLQALQQRMAEERLAMQKQAQSEDTRQFDANLGLQRDKLGVDQQQFADVQGFKRQEFAAEVPEREARTGYLRTQAKHLEEAPLRAEADRQEAERMLGLREASEGRLITQRAGEERKTNAAKPPSQYGMAPIVVQTAEGPQLLDKRTGTAKPITGQGGDAVGMPPTAGQRDQARQYGKARPILSAISELSERINVNQGAMAKIVGAAERAKAQANLSDDVGEYQAMISGFTPMIARALGHSGVLTEQDVQSVRSMFPTPDDSKSMRDRKVARIEQLMGAIEGAAGGVAPSSAPTAPQASGGMVQMVAPDGRRLNVPAEKVAELEAKGAKRR